MARAAYREPRDVIRFDSPLYHARMIVRGYPVWVSAPVVFRLLDRGLIDQPNEQSGSDRLFRLTDAGRARLAEDTQQPPPATRGQG